MLHGHIFTSLTGLAPADYGHSAGPDGIQPDGYGVDWPGGVSRRGGSGAASMYTWLSQGVVALAKMGGQVKVAHSLGSGKPEEAAKFAAGAIQMGVLFALMFAAVTVFGARPLIGFFGLSDGAIIHNAQVYLKITCGLILFSF